MNYSNYNQSKSTVEKLYFTGAKSISEIAEILDVPRGRVSNFINQINDIRKSEKISPHDEAKYLEQKLWEAIDKEKLDPSFENKQATNNLQEIYCKKLIY